MRQSEANAADVQMTWPCGGPGETFFFAAIELKITADQGQPEAMVWAAPVMDLIDATQGGFLQFKDVTNRLLGP